MTGAGVPVQTTANYGQLVDARTVDLGHKRQAEAPTVGWYEPPAQGRQLLVARPVAVWKYPGWHLTQYMDDTIPLPVW